MNGVIPVEPKANPYYSNTFQYAALTIGAEDTNVIKVTVQLQTPARDNVAARKGFLCYLSDNANGDDLIGTAHTSIAVAAVGVLIPLVAGKAFLAKTDANGVIDINITQSSGAKTAYLNIVMPDGSVQTSAAITHAA